MVKPLLALLILGVSTWVSAQTDKVVFHLHENNFNTFTVTVFNLENLYQSSEQQLDVHLLLQGDSINLLNPASISELLSERLLNLIDKGVVIETSRDNFEENELFLDTETHPKLVDNIFKRAIELQQLGYRYVTP